MNKKFSPYIIGLPNLGVGLLWAMNMTLIPMLVATFNVSNSKSAFLITMGSFTGIFVQYLSGLLSDRSHFKMGRRKPFMIMGSIATTIAMCAMPFSKSYLTLFVIAFIFYFSLNFYQGPYYSLIPETVEENQLGLANGFSKVISVLGGAFIFVTGPILWSSSSSLNKNHALPFLVAAFLGIITVIVTVLLVKEKPIYTEKKNIKLAFDFYKFPSAMKLFLAMFFIYMGYGGITPFFVKYCINNLHISEGTASFSLLLLTMTGAIFAYPLGVLSDKIERKKVMLFGSLIFTLSLLGGLFVTTTSALYIMMCFIGIGFIAIQVTSYSILAEVVPTERLGEFMGIFNFFVSFSQFISGNLMGLLLDTVGYKAFFPLSILWLVIASIILSVSKIKKYDTSLSL
ncbi:MFS transporter [Clostridium hydrogenum]|uniref:MFS transporter n=1 Tax=Clostridium hydrogenum TaxID=2855764 RepID=UPI001F1E50C3|nr:MFS transporter [Clostridium hydrogenum]